MAKASQGKARSSRGTTSVARKASGAGTAKAKRVASRKPLGKGAAAKRAAPGKPAVVSAAGKRTAVATGTTLRKSAGARKPSGRTVGGRKAASIVAAMRTWVERAVVGLTLCPFAKAVHVKGQVRYVVSRARTPEALVADLARGLRELAATDPEVVDNTLVIAPYVLDDFLDFNAFLDVADATVEALGYAGVLQVASFHPRYQFAGTEPDDVSNFSNRAPYPVLHLLREASVDRAVAAYPDADAIPNRNIATLRRLGLVGWAALGVDPPDE